MSAAESGPAPAAGSGEPEGVDPRRWHVLAVLVVGLLVVVLDNTILNVALKTIQQQLQAEQNDLIWAVNGYSLAFAALLFTWGALGDKFGRKRMLVIGLALFATASALCAFARSAPELIFFRILMGAFGACMLPISLSIVTVIFPPAERGRAIGLWAGSVGGAVAIGPILGGLLLDHPSLLEWLTGNNWGSVFFVNVPIIALGLVAIVAIVPESKNPSAPRLDPQGLLLSIAGLFALVYGIQRSEWTQWSTYAWMTAGLAVLSVFVWYERRTAHPSIDLGLFRIRSFSVSLAGIALAFGALQGTILFLAFYYQIVRGWTPLQSGLLTLPVAIGQLLGAPRSGRMVDRFGARPVISAGLGLAIIGMLLIGFVPQRAALWYILLFGFVFGYGMGNVTAPATTRMTLATPPTRSGSGSAVQNTVRQIGAALGVAIISSAVSAVYSNQISPALDRSPLPPAVRAEARDSIGTTTEVATRLIQTGRASPAQVHQLLAAANDAFMPALHVAAYCSAGFLFIALVGFLLWLPTRPEAVDWSAKATH